MNKGYTLLILALWCLLLFVSCTGANKKEQLWVLWACERGVTEGRGEVLKL